ncbi:MAG: hypothetical protein RJA21_111, partial [Gemmatimonadota bacterium]
MNVPQRSFCREQPNAKEPACAKTEGPGDLKFGAMLIAKLNPHVKAGEALDVIWNTILIGVVDPRPEAEFAPLDDSV